MVIQMASATLVWVALAVLYLWLRRKSRKFEAGKLVVLKVPRGALAEKYTRLMVEMQSEGALFEVIPYKDPNGLVLIRDVGATNVRLSVSPHWIAPVINLLDNT